LDRKRKPKNVRVSRVVWEYGEGQADRHTDTQTAVTNMHFASATPKAESIIIDAFLSVVMLETVYRP